MIKINNNFKFYYKCLLIESLKLKIEIPFKCVSEVWVPNDGRSSITESGKTITSKKKSPCSGRRVI